MIYLSTFQLSKKQVKNPNVYPYSVFIGKYIDPFVFTPITIFYGNNGSGKSTLLNIIADKRTGACNEQFVWNSRLL